MKHNASPSTKKSRLQLLHQYYSYTGFYSFIGNSLKKAVLPVVIFVAVLLGIHYFVIDLNTLLTNVTETFSNLGILSVFFASESVLGLIPPEIFIAWSEKTAKPILYLSLLAILSYLGGVVSYFIGKALTQTRSAKEYIENKMAKHIKNMRKWGGFLVVVGAMLPIPFSMTSMAAGVIKYSFKSFLLFGLLRIVRIYIYAVAIFSIV